MKYRLAMLIGINRKATQICTHVGSARKDIQQSKKILRLVGERSVIHLSFAKYNFANKGLFVEVFKIFRVSSSNEFKTSCYEFQIADNQFLTQSPAPSRLECQCFCLSKINWIAFALNEE